MKSVRMRVGDIRPGELFEDLETGKVWLRVVSSSSEFFDVRAVSLDGGIEWFPWQTEVSFLLGKLKIVPVSSDEVARA